MYKRFVGSSQCIHQAHACQTVELKTVFERMVKNFEVPDVPGGKCGSYSAFERQRGQLGDDCVREGNLLVDIFDKKSRLDDEVINEFSPVGLRPALVKTADLFPFGYVT